MAHTPADDLQRSIEDFIRGRFEPDAIMSVQVEGEREGNDVAIVDITVVLRGTPGDIARREPPGFISTLRAFVEEAHDAFPVVRLRPATL